MERSKVYENIDKEREFQDLNWELGLRYDNVSDLDKSVSEWLLYMEHHLSLAKDKIYNLDKAGALSEIRKICALGVRSMEIHGCPVRKINKGEISRNCNCSNCGHDGC